MHTRGREYPYSYDLGAYTCISRNDSSWRRLVDRAMTRSGNMICMPAQGRYLLRFIHGSDLSCISTIKGNSSVCSGFGAISFACFGTTAPSLTPRFQCWWKLHQCFSMLSYAALNPCNSAICFKHLNADWIRGLCSSAESEPLSVLSLSLPSNST